MNPAERFVYDLTKRFPALKMALRDLYQGIFDLLPEKESWSVAPVTVREGAFFGFHDHCPFSPDWVDGPEGGMLLAHRASIPLRMPLPGEAVEIGVYTGEGWMDWHPLGHSLAWNWHQGAKLQWRGDGDAFSGECMWNDVRDGRWCAVLRQVGGSLEKVGRQAGQVDELAESVSSQERVMQVPLSSISGDGRTGVGYSFARVERAMPGYGYRSEVRLVESDRDRKPIFDPGSQKTSSLSLHQPDPREVDPLAPENSHLYVTDLDSGQTTPLISLAELARYKPEPDMEDAYHFVSHALFSPRGDRFLFLHRWVKGDLRSGRSRLMTMDIRGEHLHLFPTDGMASHMAWRGDDQVLAYCSVEGQDGYVLFDDRTQRFERIGQGVLTSDGHPSFLRGVGAAEMPSRLVTDTYPDRSRRSSLLLYDMERNDRVLMGQFRHPKRFASADPHKNWRCDLHPRPDRKGRVVCFDSVHTGVRSLCTMEIPKGY